MRESRPRPILRGFSLLEMVMVLCILVVLAAIATPRMAASLVRNRVEAAAQRIAGDLALAQRYARLSSSAQAVTFDVATDSYQLPGLPDRDHVNDPYEVRLAEGPYEVSITAADFDGDAEIVFDGYGVPDSGGSVTVQVGIEVRGVSVAADSGQVTVTEFIEVPEKPVGKGFGGGGAPKPPG